jgi:hypothetical protein
VVNVSIVNWIQRPQERPGAFLLDGEQVEGINTRLQESILPVEEYEKLPANAGRAFQGPIPVGPFDLTIDEGERLLALDDADYAEVVRPYLVGDDIAKDPGQAATRFIIDFGDRKLEEAMTYPAALEIVRERVKPMRDENNDERFRRFWWQFGRPRGEMRTAIGSLNRFVSGTATGKRFLFCWSDRSVCPSNASNVFAFEDDYSMGILLSAAHEAWARSEGSTLRVDLRYTPTTCFETFPWPMPTDDQRDTIAGLSRSLIEIRRRICEAEQIGLTSLYNQVDDGAWQDLARAHRDLDRAVARAYGWPAKVAQDPLEIKARLAKRHAEIVADPSSYAPFGPAP